MKSRADPRLAVLWLAATLLALGAMAVAVYKAWPLLYPQTAERAALDPSCDLRLAACTVVFESGGSVRLDIQPRGIPVLRPLAIQVQLDALPIPRQVEVDFAGFDMDMGYNRVPLNPVESLPDPAIDPASVKLYLTAPEHYEEIALLTADSDGSWTFSQQAKMEEVIKRLKVEAAAVGANGILIRGVSDRSEDPVIITDESDDWSTGFGFSEQEKTAWAVAIWVPEGETESLFSMLGRSGLFQGDTVASVD